MKLQPSVITCRNFIHYDEKKFIGYLKNAPLGKVYNENSINKFYENFECNVKGNVKQAQPLVYKRKLEEFTVRGEPLK